jgi:hypothetical protein
VPRPNWNVERVARGRVRATYALGIAISLIGALAALPLINGTSPWGATVLDVAASSQAATSQPGVVGPAGRRPRPTPTTNANGNDNNGNGNGNDNNGNGNGNDNNGNDNNGNGNDNNVNNSSSISGLGAAGVAGVASARLSSSNATFASPDGMLRVAYAGGDPVLVAISPVSAQQALPAGAGLVHSWDLQIVPNGTPNAVTLTASYADIGQVGLTQRAPNGNVLSLMYWSPATGNWVVLPATNDPTGMTLTVNDLDVSAFTSGQTQLVLTATPASSMTPGVNRTPASSGGTGGSGGASGSGGTSGSGGSSGGAGGTGSPSTTGGASGTGGTGSSGGH